MDKRVRALGAVALFGVLAAGGNEAEVYAGRELGADEGLVVIRIERVSSESASDSASTNPIAQVLTAVLREVDGKRRATLPDSDKAVAIVLPAGRWYVDELRTLRERNLPRVMQKFQNFEVQAGKINYAGVYKVRFLIGTGGSMSAQTAIEYDPPLIEEATRAFPDAFTKWPLVYCPLSRTCKPPAEFRH